MVEQLPPTSSVNVRVRPQSVSTPNLAQHINLFLDCAAPSSPYGGAQRSAGRPFAEPYRRILVWGAPGVGKRRDLERIVEALGSDHTMLVSGAELGTGDAYERAVRLLRRAKQSGELAVLAIADYDVGGGESSPLFDDSQTPTAPRGQDGELDRILGHGSSQHLPDDRSADHRGVLAMLRSGRQRPVTDGSPAVSRILQAVQTEVVPALIVCSTSTNMADSHALLEAASTFDQVIYAPLPPFASMEAAWNDALAAVPVAQDVRTDELAALSEGLTTLDIDGVLRRAVTNMYLVKQRPLEDLLLAQADLLASLIAVKPRFTQWARSAEPRRPDSMWAAIEERTRPTLPPVAADMERLGRGTETRGELGPELLHQAALGELSASGADGSEGGWDAILNGGLN